MNEINKIFADAPDISYFAKGYFSYLKKILDCIDTLQLQSLEAELEFIREKDSTIFVAGNGGSAATATTMVNDIGFDIIKKTGIKKPFKFFSLTDNNSVITAIANDVGYENIFTSQLRIYYKPGDCLLAISVSGHSANIVNAAKWVKEQGGKVIGFLGFDGGAMKDMCDITLHVPAHLGEYGPVEDAHLILNHILAHWFQCKLNKNHGDINYIWEPQSSIAVS